MAADRSLYWKLDVFLIMDEMGTHAHLISRLGLNKLADLLVILLEEMGSFIQQLDISASPLFISLERFEDF